MLSMDACNTGFLLVDTKIREDLEHLKYMSKIQNVLRGRFHEFNSIIHEFKMGNGKI